MSYQSICLTISNSLILSINIYLGSDGHIFQSRNKLLKNARIALVKSILACPANLRWKVWLAGSRLELSTGSLDKARKLLVRAFAEVPPKSKSHVYLECSRVEEYAGNVNAARRILKKAREEGRGEWKIFLETALLETRAGNMGGAVHAANEALKIHSGTIFLSM
jgi:la-related protein 1